MTNMFRGTGVAALAALLALSLLSSLAGGCSDDPGGNSGGGDGGIVPDARGPDLVPGPDAGHPDSGARGLLLRRGTTPTIDGVLSASEWADADTRTIQVSSGWQVKVQYKHDGASLYFAFSDLVHGWSERYPEVLIDTAHDGGEAWNADDWWFHASYNDCESKGKPDDYSGCTKVLAGWKANNFPLSTPGIVEIAISYGKVGLVAGTTKRLGMAFDVTDTRSNWSFWPADATLRRPASWASAAPAATW